VATSSFKLTSLGASLASAPVYSHAHFLKVFSSAPTCAAWVCSVEYCFKNRSDHSRCLGSGLWGSLIDGVSSRSCQSREQCVASAPNHAQNLWSGIFLLRNQQNLSPSIILKPSISKSGDERYDIVGMQCFRFMKEF